jgi:tetratricopeptide (TPR) repeat protein
MSTVSGDPVNDALIRLRTLCDDLQKSGMRSEQVLVLDPDELDRRYASAYASWERRDIDCAVAEFSELILHCPQDLRFQFSFACVLKHFGEYQRALVLFNSILQRRADDPFTIYQAAECLIALREHDAARDALNAVRDICYVHAGQDVKYNFLREQAMRLLQENTFMEV